MAYIKVLMYHNIHDPVQDSARIDPYAVSPSDFAAHIDAIAARVGIAPVAYCDLEQREQNGGVWAITFDDGRDGSLLAADVLEARGWRGHFFVVTDLIGSPGFLSREQILELHVRGHVIGSHSASHPPAMASMCLDDLVVQWQGSVEVLSELLGVRVEVGAVPGGSYSRAVAAAAAQAGIRTLFTSEPSSATHRVDGCLVVGRYLVRGATSRTTVAGLAAGWPLPRCSQMARWKTRNVAVAILGGRYGAVRATVLRMKGSR
jgi:peptidoglycan/xylan/chitin deacetylase (PgdA/CDA1 family)